VGENDVVLGGGRGAEVEVQDEVGMEGFYYLGAQLTGAADAEEFLERHVIYIFGCG
jgi:hypothetical protein